MIDYKLKTEIWAYIEVVAFKTILKMYKRFWLKYLDTLKVFKRAESGAKNLRKGKLKIENCLNFF